MSMKKTFTAGGTIIQYALVSLNGTTSDSVIVCPANGAPIGVAQHAASSGEAVTVEALEIGGVYKGVASEALTVHEAIYTAASGKVQDKTTATLSFLGYARQAASADGDVFEFVYQPIAAASVTT